MKIAIKFGDNDFFLTYQGVLSILLEAYRKNGVLIHKRNKTLKEEKAELVRVINELSNTCYFLFQTNGKESRHDDYLQINENQLFIGNEVDEYLDSVRRISRETGEYYINENREFHILDTDLDYPHNEPIYSL